MPRPEYFPALRRNPRRERQIAEIARRIGAEDEFASVIDYALALAMKESEMITVVSSTVEPVQINIETARASITQGYQVRLVLEANDRQIEYIPPGVCVTEFQSEDWCQSYVEKHAPEVGARLTPGELYQILQVRKPIEELGLTVPTRFRPVQ